MADEEKEVIVEEAVDGAEEPQDASEAEEASSPTPEAETQSEGSAEPESLPPPEWMRMLFAPAAEEQPAKPAEAAKPADEPLDLGDTLLTEKELAIVKQLVARERAEDKAEIERLRSHIDRFVGRDVTREVKTTVAEVYNRTYNGVFKNDPTFRSNPAVAAQADSAVQTWCRLAAMRAQETGDTSSLEFARSPAFGKAVLALAKIATGADGGTSPTIIPKGAEVESSSTGAKSKPADSKPRIRLSKEDRAQMERVGVTDSEIEEAMALKAKYGAL